VVLDGQVLADVASELASLSLGGAAGRMPPARLGQHASQIDGFGVGYDRNERIARG
jgi:hypothetical protein